MLDFLTPAVPAPKFLAIVLKPKFRFIFVTGLELYIIFPFQLQESHISPIIHKLIKPILKFRMYICH